MDTSDEKEEKAFVILNQDGIEETYFLRLEAAFNIARNTYGQALVCLGNKRFRFKDGEPLLQFQTE